MTVSSPPTYRNIRPNYYTDKASDNSPVGAIINTFKATTDVYDNQYTPISAYAVTTGNANTQTNPEHQYPGYLYCDGAEYEINDFPALYSIIGNDYGGSPRQGIEITNGGSGYAAGTTISFDPPPPGGTNMTATLVIVNGVITGITLTDVGAGYVQEPSFTVASAGGGSGLQLELNFGNGGEIQTISPENVYDHWGSTRTLGTFKVPDLKTRKVVGYGNVYGQGSPSIGLLTLGAGGNNGVIKQGGSWYFDKGSQAGYFSLGSITTTGYTNITDDVSTSIIGSQKVHVTMQERRLQRVPDHSHFIYSTAADDTFTFRSSIGGDRYLVNYTNSNARLYGWQPIGGLHFQHKHGLSKSPLASREAATYDVFDWRAGAEGTGSIKYTSPDFYFASGGSDSGTFEEVTETAPSMFRTFTGNPPPNAGSVIGGRQIRTGGKDIITYTQDVTYSGTSSISFPPAWTVMEVEMHGGGGSGSSGEAAGNDGEDVNLTVVAGGTLLDITAGGGQGGGKSNNYTSGGTGGVTTSSGSALTDGSFTADISQDGTAGQTGTGQNGVFPGVTNPTNPNVAGTGGIGLVENVAVGAGSDGIHTQIGGSPVTTTEQYTSTSLGTVNLSTTSEFTDITFTIRGGQGADSQRGPNSGNPIGGAGSKGTVMILEWLNPEKNT